MDYTVSYGVVQHSEGLTGWTWIPLLVVGLLAWLALARSSLIQGGGMERPERVPQLYGYAVCLVAIVVMLVSVSTLVEKGFALANPLTVEAGPFGWGGGPSLTSFASFRATRDGISAPIQLQRGAGAAAAPAEPTETELRAEYEALRADRLARTRFEAGRDLVRSALLLLIGAVLFWWHWRWLRGAELRTLAARGVAREGPAAG